MASVASCFWCGMRHGSQHPLSVCPPCLGVLRARRFPLGLLEMSGSFPLDGASIDEIVTRASPGNYALGYVDEDTFQVFYVGRADADLRDRLHAWVDRPSRCGERGATARAAWSLSASGAPLLAAVGAAADDRYTHFAYSYAPSAEAAFAKECRNYDDFGGYGGLDNSAHPDAPAR